LKKSDTLSRTSLLSEVSASILNNDVSKRALQSTILFILLCVAFSAPLVRNSTDSFLSEDSYLYYQAATLGVNYFDFGFVRRGLGGSLAHLLSNNLMLSTLMFYMIFSSVFAALISVLFGSLKVALTRRLAFALISLGIALRWSEDIGRTDVLVANFLALITLALRKDRLDWAAAFVGLGLFVHESSLIFGGPLIVSLALTRRFHGISRSMLVRAVTVVMASVICYLSMGFLPHSDTTAVVDTLRAKLIPHLYVDWALYYALSGTRGVATSICQNWIDPSYWEHVLGGGVVLILTYLALSVRGKRNLAFVMIATIPPFIFLSVVANDIGRWTILASLNLWLVSSLQPPNEQSLIPHWLVIVFGVCFFPLTHSGSRIASRLGLEWANAPVYSGSPAIESILTKLGAPTTPSLDEILEHCDPRWRDVLDERAASAPGPK
jgi:hypothetical protein